ncbi:RNA polymerase subunit sigma-70 [Actinokineospora sp. NBRC 105648]|uniref:RNA polymerase subunit sigma-70 n=1 Tax=Actinokineospora sp. NBRC 105648 TaxID=3032206 RepID=UPI0024A0BB1B|nr:RNA polymerase subunit sigma-70 [Actinokineospora sp. NBRC 105648]GLZ37240.1 RNA polymerase sigma factor [Actinokineospora sp. NBRC 105648]
MDEAELVAAARRGDHGAFERLVSGHRRELHAHCYRMLGSVQDAEDAVQEALLAAWRGLGGFAGRSSTRTWLYRVATNVCLRVASRRPPRVLSPDYGPARTDTADLGELVTGPVWLEPWFDDDPAERYLRRESVELAFVAALQHLPGTQRAVLILREVLQFSAAEVAAILDTSVPSVNSALQRARKTVDDRLPETAQRDELAATDSGVLVDKLVAAWERADVDGLRELLTEDARFTMPPLPAWFDGRDAVLAFFADRVFETPWRLTPTRVNGQPGLVCLQGREGGFALSGVNVLTLRSGRISEITAFLDPALHRFFAGDR